MAGRRRNGKVYSAKSVGCKSSGALHCDFRIYFGTFVVAPWKFPTVAGPALWWDGWAAGGFRRYHPDLAIAQAWTLGSPGGPWPTGERGVDDGPGSWFERCCADHCLWMSWCRSTCVL